LVIAVGSHDRRITRSRVGREILTVFIDVAIGVDVSRGTHAALRCLVAAIECARSFVVARDGFTRFAAVARPAHFAPIAVGLVLAQAVVGSEPAALEFHVARIERALDAVIALLVVDAATSERLVTTGCCGTRIVSGE
jgi:hypothetical protein